MNPLLIYFREEFIELWSLDNNGRLLPIMYNSSNQLPLYFLLSGEEILMNKYAKDAYLKNEANSFGDFWKNLENNSISYDRFASNNSFSTLLPYVLKEAVLPLIAKSHFHTNLSHFLKDANTAILFDSFVEEKHKQIILNLFLEIIGFDPNTILSFDYFDSFREAQIKSKAITQSDSFILANISCGNFYFHLIGKNSPLHLAKKVLEGKGQDPILDCVLDFLVEIAQAKGSMLNYIDIKKEIKNDAIAILSKIPDGLVIHTVRNNNLDVNPLKISFHKNDIEGRINNRQSLNFIQNEFDSFRRQNNAEQLPIFLGGEIINRSVFRDFFNKTYSKVNFEEVDFNSKIIIYCANRLLKKGKSKSDDIQIPATAIKTSPKATPPVVKTPSIPAKKISVLEIKQTPKPEVKKPPIIKPEVKLPPVIKDVKKVEVPPLPPRAKVPPPPPPPPPIKKK
jgi:hypothetical protein